MNETINPCFSCVSSGSMNNFDWTYQLVILYKRHFQSGQTAAWFEFLTHTKNTLGRPGTLLFLTAVRLSYETKDIFWLFLRFLWLNEQSS